MLATGLARMSDEELISLVRSASANERDALQEVLARYLQRRRMASWVRRELRKRGPCSDADVDDCVQAAGMRLIREIRNPEHELPAPFERAVRAACSYSALDQLRRRAIARDREGSTDPTQMEEQVARHRGAADEEDPNIVALRSDMDFETRISILAQEDQDIVRRHLLEDQPYEQIARELGKSPDAVRQRFSRAIKHVASLTTGIHAYRRVAVAEMSPRGRTDALVGLIRARPSRRSRRLASILVDRALRHDS
jgi:RNA polymerase sigma factor (sigma-70 family)